jgi:hypothetical protein
MHEKHNCVKLFSFFWIKKFKAHDTLNLLKIQASKDANSNSHFENCQVKVKAEVKEKP